MAAFLHIDMDAFFAAVEEFDHPAWRGKPIIVGADPKGGAGRGVVSTASYAARAFGVGSAMPISRAWKRCPGGIYVRPRMGRYAEVSDRIMTLFHSFTPRVQPISLDEAFLDVSGSIPLFGDPVTMAHKIKRKVFEHTGLTCSAGVSGIKSVAKIASDMDKPDGVTIVPDGGEIAFLAPLEVRRLWGVGPRAARIMARAGIHKVRDIQNRSRTDLVRLLGKAHGEHIFNMANAIDPREVNDDEKALSISHETTFLADVMSPELIGRTLLWLADKVATRLREHGIRGRVVTLKYRTEDFKTFTRRTTLAEPVEGTNALFETAKHLAETLKDKPRKDKPRKVRLLGIGVSRLEASGKVQKKLFEVEGMNRDRAAEKAVDRVRARFGKRAIFRGSFLEEDE